MAKDRRERYQRMLVRLREARQEAGLTQGEAAQALGFRQQVVSKIELGERRITPVELQDLAHLYGKPVDHFLE